MKLEKLCEIMEGIAPLECAFSWDNSGLILSMHEDVQNIMLCLDVTDEVIAEAVEKGADTLISHHPVLFTAEKQFSIEGGATAALIAAAKAGLNVYSAHTSYDCAEGGMNYALAEKLGITVDFMGEGMTVGNLAAPMSAEDFAKHVKAAINATSVQYTPSCTMISRVACLGGSGSDYIAAARAAGAQALVTGEAKHHHFLEARAEDFVLIEAGHYDTEIVFVEAVKTALQKAFNELQYNVRVFAANSGCPYVGL